VDADTPFPHFFDLEKQENGWAEEPVLPGMV
jgi:hypothetical protein